MTNLLRAMSVAALIAAAFAVAACAGGNSTLPTSAGALERSSTGTYNTLYRFAGAPNDGSAAFAALIDVGGTLYGTTSVGGSAAPCAYQGGSGCGTVFTMTPSGTENEIYSFKGPRGDGGSPIASLIDVKGTLYGTTAGGGKNSCGGGFFTGCGTVFSITPSGKETVLYSFKGGKGDGQNPYYGSLAYLKGAFYGTARYGGKYGDGIVFKVTTSGKETVLHSFGSTSDGAGPAGGLIEVGGILYGTTSFGTPCSYGCGKKGSIYGTVFTITPSGKETVLYSFQGGKSDGENPLSSLINVGGTLYGTAQGGAKGQGTVFSITTSGKETVLYNFIGGKGDGASPYASLTDVNGTLYGTTVQGGSKDAGTLFAVTTSGQETMLHSFGQPSDGAFPFANLIYTNGVLYGTTSADGTSNHGTVFEYTP